MKTTACSATRDTLRRVIMNRFPALVLAASIAVLVACAGGDAGSGDGTPAKLVLGLVPATEANVMIDNAEPLASFLAAEIGIPVESFVPQDYTGLVEAMGSGRADIGMIPPFASMLAFERYGIETILISLRDGDATYHAQWMTRDRALCDSEPEPRPPYGYLFCDGDLERVRGKRVAFTDPTSTSGHLFPALQLLDLGINPERDVKSVFVGGHDASVIAVYNGDVDVGVSFDDARSWVAQTYADIGRAVIVFNEGEPIPNDGVTVRGDLPAEVKEAIRRAFKKLTDEQAALPREEQILWKIYEIDGFVDFTPGLHEPVVRAFREMRDKIDLGR